MSIPLLTCLRALAAVFPLIVVRQVGRFTFQIWEAMTLGGLAVLLSGSMTPAGALRAVTMDVMLFLFGIFFVGHALEGSGHLAHQSYKFIERGRSIHTLMLKIIAGAGMLSAILMNDTLVIVGTPVVLLIARMHGMSPKLFLLALAFAITPGSVLSPIGNPQDLLIALNGRIDNLFMVFFRHLFLPTALNLALTFMVLKGFYMVSIVPSQLISNVPLVSLHQPLLLQAMADTPELMALAAGSTIAGDMLILGAASNVIIIHNAERRGGGMISFLEFARLRIPLTLLQAGGGAGYSCVSSDHEHGSS